jgi:hypothetical protein
MLALGKKVMVVSSWAPPMVGGPQNLYNLFSQFTPDSYCILTRHETVLQREVTGSKLSGKYFFCDAPSENQRSLIMSFHVQKGTAEIDRMRRRVPAIADNPFIKNSVTATAKMVRMGVRIVREKGIEFILGISDEGPALISSYLISRITGVPYALWLFDIYRGNNLTPVSKLLAMIFERRLVENASVVIVTNECTRNFYRNRYGSDLRCAVVHNSIFPSDYEATRTPYAPREPYTVVFTGNLFWPQERSLFNLINALDRLRDLPIRLDLYIPNASASLRKRLSARSNIRLMAAPQSEMPGIQCKSTILFIPLSWHTRAPEVIATATPGKLADYLASGRPILVHAPPYACLSKYARENAFALVVDEENSEKLQEGIRRLVFDLKYSCQLIENAKRTLYAKHDAYFNAKKLAGIIGSVSRSASKTTACGHDEDSATSPPGLKQRIDCLVALAVGYSLSSVGELAKKTSHRMLAQSNTSPREP